MRASKLPSVDETYDFSWVRGVRLRTALNRCLLPIQLHPHGNSSLNDLRSYPMSWKCWRWRIIPAIVVLSRCATPASKGSWSSTDLAHARRSP
jgi:hypothetical protein